MFACAKTRSGRHSTDNHPTLDYTFVWRQRDKFDVACDLLDAIVTIHTHNTHRAVWHTYRLHRRHNICHVHCYASFVPKPMTAETNLASEQRPKRMRSSISMPKFDYCFICVCVCPCGIPPNIRTLLFIWTAFTLSNRVPKFNWKKKIKQKVKPIERPKFVPVHCWVVFNFHFLSYISFRFSRLGASVGLYEAWARRTQQVVGGSVGLGGRHTTNR